jgi:hypothetical protein
MLLFTMGVQPAAMQRGPAAQFGHHTEQAAHRVQHVALNGLDRLDVSAASHGDGGANVSQ